MKGNFPVPGDPTLNPNLDTELANAIAANPAAFTADPSAVVALAKPVINTDKNTYITNPLKVSTSSFMPNATVGLRIKLLILTLYGQYTVQEYPMVTGGLGFSIR
jgi:hypothetical protein